MFYFFRGVKRVMPICLNNAPRCGLLWCDLFFPRHTPFSVTIFLHNDVKKERKMGYPTCNNSKFLTLGAAIKHMAMNAPFVGEIERNYITCLNLRIVKILLS
jgi:hypothetical protein